MSEGEKEKEDLEAKPDEIQDLDVPGEEGEEVRGGLPPKIMTKTCTCSEDCLTQ
jgi:hypothetical protein